MIKCFSSSKHVQYDFLSNTFIQAGMTRTSKHALQQPQSQSRQKHSNGTCFVWMDVSEFRAYLASIPHDGASSSEDEVLLGLVVKQTFARQLSLV